jgi:hypothetical protein
MDALERYQDTGGKKFVGLVPASISLRYGPKIQQALVSALHIARGYTSPLVIPGGYERIYLYHIRKTAGTSLVRSFLTLGGEDPAEVEQRIAASLISRTTSGKFMFACGRGTLQQGDYFFGWSHMPAHRLELPAKTFTIALLRDPVARVLSYYRYLIAGDTEDSMAWRVQENERSLAGLSFSDFLQRTPRELLLNQLYMFSPTFNVEEARLRITQCSAILTTEEYDKDLARLSQSLDLSLSPRRERITAPTGTKPADEDVAELRQILAPEYELLEGLETNLPQP